MWIELEPKDFDVFLDKLKPENLEKIEIYGVLEDGTIERVEME